MGEVKVEQGGLVIFVGVTRASKEEDSAGSVTNDDWGYWVHTGKFQHARVQVDSNTGRTEAGDKLRVEVANGVLRVYRNMQLLPAKLEGITGEVVPYFMMGGDTCLSAC